MKRKAASDLRTRKIYTITDAVGLSLVQLLFIIFLLFLQLLRRIRQSHIAPAHTATPPSKTQYIQKLCAFVCVCARAFVCVFCSRQSLQEQVVERLLAAAAARHVEQQRVSE